VDEPGTAWSQGPAVPLTFTAFAIFTHRSTTTSFSQTQDEARMLPVSYPKVNVMTMTMIASGKRSHLGGSSAVQYQHRHKWR